MRKICLLILVAAAIALFILGFPASSVRAVELPTNLAHPDEACAGCHKDIYDRYEKTPMAQGSGEAVTGFIPGHLDHTPSGITYSVFERDGKVWLSYLREGSSDKPLKGEKQLQYYVGSGRRGRTYLFNEDGLWFEAPINYYGKKQLWDMAPNYGSVHTLPLTLPVDSNCLHCHAGAVSAAEGDVRNRYAGAPFAAAGIGCAACHGDPTAHIAEKQNHQTIGEIVNPAKLSVAARDSTCLQCHLEGDVSIYKHGKSLADFRAGDDITDYVTYFVDSSKPGFGSRASSQYEALLRSACRRALGDRLTCTTCHDPHSSPSPQERVSYFRGKCLGCHTGEAMRTQHHPEQQDCAVCHMPTRNTQDISHEQLTDHNIQRVPPTYSSNSDVGLQLQDLNQARTIKTPRLVPVGQGAAGSRELGLAYAQLARSGDQTAGGKAERLLGEVETSGKADEPVHVQLGFLKQISGNAEAAAKEYREALLLDGGNETALANLAVIEAASGHSAHAVELLKKLVEEDPSRTSAGLNLAFIYCKTGQTAQARATLAAIRTFNPDNVQLRGYIEHGNYGGQSCKLAPE